MSFEDDDQAAAATVEEVEKAAPQEEVSQQEDTGDQTAAEPEAQEEKPAKKGGDRRFAHLTARAAAEAARADQAERRAQELQQLLEARNNGDQTQAPVTQVDIERRASEMVSLQALESKRVNLVKEGVKSFGEEAWNEKTQYLADVGATNNKVFMRAIVTAPHGDKIVSELADDPDRLAALMNMDSTDMAVEMGRLSAEVSGTKGRKVTQAPAPTKNLAARAAPITPDIYNTKSMSMAEYAAYRAKSAPRHLGGGR
jgi:hypothetical protein